MVEVEPARCAVCGEELAEKDYVLLERGGENVWVVVSEGLNPGEGLAGDLLIVHKLCLVQHGTKISELPPRG